MITAIEGILQDKGSGWAVIKVGGISLRALVPESTLVHLGLLGESVRLHTFLQFREDNITLCGFADVQELRLFSSLMEVRGVGVRLAMALLSAGPPEALASAIISGDQKRLSQIPGVGKTTAGRLILELKDKLAKEWNAESEVKASDDNEIVAALTGLGYSLIEVRAAISQLTLDPQSSMDDRVRLVLQSLSRSR